MENFNYHLPKSVGDAAKLLDAHEDAKLMSGGMTLLPTLKQRLAAPSDLIDLAAIPDIKGVCRDGDELVIGAMTTHAEVHEHALVRELIPGLASLAGQIGDQASAACRCGGCRNLSAHRRRQTRKHWAHRKHRPRPHLSRPDHSSCTALR